MCGIAGWAGDGVGPSEAPDAHSEWVAGALRTMHHRGPDALGVRTLPATGPGRSAVLGAVRLRVVDLSPAGDQPLANEDGTVWVVYNGELYNAGELRAELRAAGHQFRSHTDTECLVHLYEHVRGDPERLLVRLRGMFALAIWDTSAGRLVLARDRLGIKPLSWTYAHGGVAFASEVRALASGVNGSSPSPDLGSVAGYLAWGVVPGPHTLLESIERLPPGHLLSWSGGHADVRRWWMPRLQPEAVFSDRREAERELGTALIDSISRHLVADRRVGLFLSSGTDSAVVGHLAARQGAAEALTVSFPEHPQLDEGPTAGALARSLGLTHAEVPATAATISDHLDAMLRSMDQPTVDAVNTWLVCDAAREAGFVVALSGLGGDELLGGYRTFSLVPRLHRMRHAFAPVPRPALGALARLARARAPGGRVSRSLTTGPGLTGAYAAVRGLFGPLERARLAPAASSASNGPGPREEVDGRGVDAVMLLELRHYLADQLLPDTDSVSMAHSIEVRVPLLDDTVVAWAMALPTHIRATAGKQLLSAAGCIGQHLPKRPFTPPFGTWMRGPLRPVVRDAVLSSGLPFATVLPAPARRELWSAFEAGRVHWSRPWAIAVLRLWPGANDFRWD